MRNQKQTCFLLPSAFFSFQFCLFYSIVLIILCVVECSFAQSSSRIDRLFGGNIGLDIKWSGNLFTGLGARADAMGGSISTLFFDAQSIASNPAGLGFARGLSFALDWTPPLKIDPVILTKRLGISDIEQRINNTLNETAAENAPESGVSANTVEDAIVNSQLDMRGGLKAAALMYGNPIFTIAGSFHQPFSLETQIAVSGMEFLAAALDERGSETQRIFGTVNGNFNINLNIETTTLGMGLRLLPNLAVGLAFDNMNAEMNFEGTFLPEGIISSAGGDTRSFNDPGRVQYDSLFAVIRGDWEGNAFRMRGGIGYHPTASISLDATYAMPFTIDLLGPFSMIHNKIRALNLGAGEDEEVFDVDVLVEDNLTKTEKKITSIPGIDLEIPGSLSFGFSASWSNYVTSIVYTRYLGNLGYRLSYQQFDSLLVEKKAGEIHQGEKLQQAFRIAFGVKPFMLGLGAIIGTSFRETTRKGQQVPDIASGKQLILPFFSLGGGLNLSSHFRLDYVFSLYNSSFFRFTTTYKM